MTKSFVDVFQNYPFAAHNNARKIVRETVEKFLEKPSYGLEVKLRRFGIGVDWSHEYGDDARKVEGFYLIDRKGEDTPISDELLGELLR